MIDRYNAIYTFCRLYEEWCLKRKSEQVDDITKKDEDKNEEASQQSLSEIVDELIESMGIPKDFFKFLI